MKVSEDVVQEQEGDVRADEVGDDFNLVEEVGETEMLKKKKQN